MEARPASGPSQRPFRTSGSAFSCSNALTCVPPAAGAAVLAEHVLEGRLPADPHPVPVEPADGQPLPAPPDAGGEARRRRTAPRWR